MFSSKSNRGKWAWAFVDLLVVIIGVYIAFLMQSSASERNDQKEQIKIFSALKMELEAFRVGFPQFANSNYEYLKSIEDQELHDISGWRFIEPQYGYQIIEYAINIQNTEIIDFSTYEMLQKLYVNIKQLEHTERLITQLSGEYQYTIPELDASHPLNMERMANNRSRIVRFKMFLRGRAANLNRTSEDAMNLLEQINAALGPVLKKEIDIKYIASNISRINSEDQALRLVKKYFPGIEEDTIRNLYREAKGSTGEETD